MNSQRILQVITRSEWGGAPRVVESLATQIDDVAAVACGPGGRLIDRLENEGVSVHVQPHLQSTPHPKDVLAYRDLRQLIDEGDFDLVHSHSTKAGALARIAASRAGVPSVFTVHGWGFYNTEYSVLRPLVIRGERFLERRTEEIVCVSRNDRQQGQRHEILSANEGTIIHNGIPPLELPSDRKTLHDEYRIDRNTPIIGSIGRIAPQKNPLANLETAKHLREQGHDVATVLIGSGPLEERCHRYIDDHNMKNTYMPGFVEDALEFLPDFDVFLLPSRFEGFPITVLECMHAGVPLVASDVGGVAEAIDDGETGFVVPPNTTDGLFVDRVETLIEDPQRRHEMSRRAQAVAATQFTEERMVSEYQEVYQTIL
ncbi:glycosyltransferase family 4 protein [Halorhabdus amylolytica]|uniref:glycosyltransferase family 4 protein n=1 Tax=Halorhabdus amylolytica TaxID=2559573 RepID=UPI0010A9D7AB|nr:glycosyltransferase family 4 protein [Halorhabdus amylolytica]